MSTNEPSTPIPFRISLGDVIAERRFTLHEATGVSRLVWVRLGKPVAVDQAGVPQPTSDPHTFRCPFQIVGLECDDKIFAPFGEDPFVALQYAIRLTGDILKRESKRLHLTNPIAAIRERTQPGGPHFEDAGGASWIWEFDSRPDLDYGL